jgi:glycosyltransferase involved in cell wall biosynthesis
MDVEVKRDMEQKAVSASPQSVGTDLSILVPVYDEERFIEPLLRKVVEAAKGSDIIVIDDGSLDQTTQILARLANELPIRVATHARNSGKGAAIRTGLELAHGAIVVIQDADLEYDPEDYPALLKPLLQHRVSVVYGSRFLGPHHATYFWHRLGNGIITTLVNVLFNASLTDVETGYKVFRKEVLRDIVLRARSFELEVELTCKILRTGQTIFEVPIAYYGRTYAQGKKITWRDGLTAIFTILRCRVDPRY